MASTSEAATAATTTTEINAKTLIFLFMPLFSTSCYQKIIGIITINDFSRLYPNYPQILT
jgi:hypothetical protein